MSTAPESRLVKRMHAAILERWPNAWVVKVHGGMYQTVGIPDLLVVVEGQLVGIEAKQQGPSESYEHAAARVTATQASTLAAIIRAGGTAGVALTVEEALELVESALSTVVSEPGVLRSGSTASQISGESSPDQSPTESPRVSPTKEQDT